LQSEANSLSATAKSLNQSTDQFNSQVGKLNQTINTFNDALTFKPEEGIFIGAEKRIEIYFNINQNELVHTLAQELGHSLGLAHNQNSKSIMYPSTTLSLPPSVDDIKALEEVCRPRSILELVNQRFNDLKTTYLQPNL
jgi:hypothetical protein